MNPKLKLNEKNKSFINQLTLEYTIKQLIDFVNEKVKYYNRNYKLKNYQSSNKVNLPTANIKPKEKMPNLNHRDLGLFIILENITLQSYRPDFSKSYILNI